MALEHSRPVRLAVGASGRGESELERALEAARVVVSADASLPGALLTTRVLLTTLRRLPGQLALERDGLPQTAVDEIAEAVTAVDPERPLTIGRASEATVRLHVGTGRGDEAVRLAPEAHGARVAGQRSATIRPTRSASALGAIYTAALGAAEAFKFTAHVRPERRVLHRHLRFCPVTLSSDLAAAPMLVQPLELAVTLAGIGAIGTGVVLILSELDAFGRLIAVDYENFAPENRGTYSLGGPPRPRRSRRRSHSPRPHLPASTCCRSHIRSRNCRRRSTTATCPGSRSSCPASTRPRRAARPNASGQTA